MAQTNFPDLVTAISYRAPMSQSFKNSWMDFILRPKENPKPSHTLSTGLRQVREQVVSIARVRTWKCSICGLTCKCSLGAIKWLSNVMAIGTDNSRNYHPRRTMRMVLKGRNVQIVIGIA